MIKPLLLTLEYPPQIGGIAQYLKGEVENFTGAAAVNRVGASGKFSWLPLLWRSRREYRRQGCDGLWISHVLPVGYVALVWKRLFGTPYRVYVHGLDLARPQKSGWKKFWVKRILSSADEIVANSNATAGLLSKYGLNPSRARVQYPHLEKIDTSAYYKTGVRLRRQHNINDKPLLLTISRLVKRKGIDLVIKALPAVWQQIPDLVYVVVGKGEEKENLTVIARPVASGDRPKQSYNRIEDDSTQNNLNRDDKIASPASRNDKIILTGSVTDEIKYGWLAACDCFILTPIDDPDDFEGYGIVYKEAWAFGKPVIGARVGGVPEAVGEDGILVEAGNVDRITKAILGTFSQTSN